MTDNEHIAFANCKNGKITNYSLHANSQFTELSENPLAAMMFGYNTHSFNFSGIEHTHQCSSCKNWTDAQRTNYICQRCNNEKSIECKSIHNCPVCEGTGFVNSEISQFEEDKIIATNLFLELIDKWTSTHPEYQLSKDLKKMGS
jgi:hypothetical protein